MASPGKHEAAPGLDDVPLGALFGAMTLLIFLSACFSASETAMMALNRYRLRHLADSGHRGAIIASRLLERPDRLLGVILLGNNFVNIAASSVATIIALRLYGDAAIAAAAFLLTLVVLIFAEVAPKTLAAMHPERIAFPAAYVLRPMLAVLYPVVWAVNGIANYFLRLLGVEMRKRTEHLNPEELRSVVRQAGPMIPKTYRAMLLRILDLEKVTVEDIMVPRSMIEFVDLEDDWEDLVEQLATSHHTRLPVCRGMQDNVVGVVHVRQVLHLTHTDEFNKAGLERIMQTPYFIPAGTPLTRQLLNMQSKKQRMGLIVDEYGDLQGLVTLEEILEEIVGEFTTAAPSVAEDVVPQDDGSYLVNASANVRDLNRKMEWELPTDGPKTINGLILEHFEDIPEPGTSLLLAGYPLEIIQTRGTAVRVVRIDPQRKTG